jgi:SAM-dependent methyltransferase
LCSWIERDCDSASWLLDVGAGDGDDGYAQRLRSSVACIVGVDPDPICAGNSVVDELCPTTIEDYARYSTERFRTAVAVFVAEHIAEPAVFLAAIRACLEEGGSLYLLTPSLWHYYGLGSRLLRGLRIDRRVHAWLSVRCAEMHESAYYPLHYRLNTVRSLASAAEQAGFGRMEVAFLEDHGVFEPFFPARLRFVPRSYSRVVHRLNRRRKAGVGFGTLLCRLTVPPALEPALLGPAPERIPNEAEELLAFSHGLVAAEVFADPAVPPPAQA